MSPAWMEPTSTASSVVLLGTQWKSGSGRASVNVSTVGAPIGRLKGDTIKRHGRGSRVRLRNKTKTYACRHQWLNFVFFSFPMFRDAPASEARFLTPGPPTHPQVKGTFQGC